MIKPSTSYALTDNGYVIKKGSKKSCRNEKTKLYKSKEDHRRFVIWDSPSSKIGDFLS